MIHSQIYWLLLIQLFSMYVKLFGFQESQPSAPIFNGFFMYFISGKTLTRFIVASVESE